MAPLKIGILGAARIADDGIVNPSRVLGHRLVAVAARDRSRAEAFGRAGLSRRHPWPAALGHERGGPPDDLDDYRVNRHGGRPSTRCPHMDNRIVITRDGSTQEQTLGEHTSYTDQLAALAHTLQTGAEFLIDVEDSVANAELIDDVYRRAKLSPRG